MAEKRKHPAVEKPRPKIGRPKALTEALAEDLLSWIARGKSLRRWCEQDGHPHHKTVLREIRENESLRARYVHAREDQADFIFDEALEIADDGRNDTYIDDDGTVKVNHDVVQRSRLRVEQRRWMAGKLRPKVYGEKLFVEDQTKRPLTLEEVREAFARELAEQKRLLRPGSEE